jgi:hypothetical protein
MGVMFALIALGLFVTRGQFRMVKAWICIGLVCLQLVMNSPVYSLIARIDIIGGSTGWHRYALIDAAIREFRTWWLLGIDSTAAWGHGLFDVTNQFVLVAVNGGLLSLVLFVALLGSAYRGVGTAWRRAPTSGTSFLMWSIGASLFCHCMCFLAVSYFAQIVTLWNGSLAIAAALRTPSFFSGNVEEHPSASLPCLAGNTG